MRKEKKYFYCFTILFFMILVSCVLANVQTISVVNYEIDASLNVPEKSISGRELLTWYNDSSEEVEDLQFHLYLNGFKNEKSTFFKELEFSPFTDDEWGWIDIVSFKIVNGDNLTDRIEFIHPEDNKDDQTVIRVVLPEPVKPHQKITVDIDFYAKLPRAFRRVGYSQDFFFLCQWYPKLGVYEEKGERGAEESGWNCHEFHESSEFYADFGTFDITLTVPAHFVVGASGELLSEKNNLNGFKTLRFYGENIHDFAWTADPHFIVFEDRFSYYGLQDVKLIYLCQPGHEFTAKSHFGRAKDVLKYYGLWFGAYPYKTLTIVDPGRGANSGGMEYPNLITGGTSTWFKYWPLNRIPFLDMVIVHEAGHQWWYGKVGNNEFEDAWLDEGINTYCSEFKVSEIIYPDEIQCILFKGFTMSMADLHKAIYIVAPKSDPIQKNCWEFYSSGNAYYYSKAALMLKTLENYIGQEAMLSVLRSFFEKWKFKHPGPRDFINNLENTLGKDFSWFFNQFLYGTNVLDYSVSKIESNELTRARGMFNRGTRKIQTSEKEGISLGFGNQENERLFRNIIYVKRLGEAVFPVEIEIKFENDDTIRETWDGKERWKRFEYVKPYRVEYAAVDPDNKIPLDVNITNNSRILQLVSGGPFRLFLKWMFWIQNFFDILSTIS